MTTVHQLLNKIQRELKAPKFRFNSFGKYYSRSCEDILEAVKPLLGEGYLTINDEVVMISHRFYIKATSTLTLGGEFVSATAYAREAEEKKGMDAAQCSGSASSYARKYSLSALFCIDDSKDADTEEHTQQRMNPVDNSKTITETINSSKTLDELKNNFLRLLKSYPNDKELIEREKDIVKFKLSDKEIYND